MRSYKAEAIVLSRKNIGEADKLITLFTKQYGKKVVVAKGIRRITSRRAPHLELFSHVILILHSGKTLDYVSEVTQLNAFTHVKTRLERIGYVYIVLELVNKFTAENQESYIIFERLLAFLHRLNETKTTRHEAKNELVGFKQLLLSELGFIEKMKPLSEGELDQVIVNILETDLKSPRLLTSLQQGL